ncbi:DUF342 domain-containing protein [Mesoaciditoga sp.]
MKEMLFKNMQELFDFLEREYGMNWHNKIMVDVLNDVPEIKDGKAFMKVRIYDIDEVDEIPLVENDVLTDMDSEENLLNDAEKIKIPQYPQIEVNVSKDKMKAYVTIYPGMKKEVPTVEEIFSSLKENKVIFGIKEWEIKRIVSEKCVLRPVLIAEGKPPIPSKNATYKLLFLPSGIRVKRNDGKRVNYASMYEIVFCRKGEKLVEKVVGVDGKKGYNVFGEELGGEKAEDLSLQPLAGKNTALSEDGMFVFATLDGQPFFSEDGKVNVNEIFIVNGNLGYDVGNIDFPGSVWIRGNVEEAFKIKSGKDVLIDGIVGEAEINAKSNILVKGGVFGKNKGILRCEGNFKAKFLSEVTIISHGNVEVDEYIMNSRIISRGNVIVNGKGWIVGGSVKAGLNVNVNVIGSISKVPTHVSAGINFDFSSREEELESKLMKELKKMEEASSYMNKIMSLFKKTTDESRKRYLLTILDRLRDEKTKLLEEMQILRKNLDLLNSTYRWKNGRKDSRITVKQRCFEGARITINNETIVLHFDVGPTIFSYDDIEQKILTTPYKNWN